MKKLFSIIIYFLIFFGIISSVYASLPAEDFLMGRGPVITSRQKAIEALDRESKEGGISDISLLPTKYQCDRQAKEGINIPSRPFNVKNLNEIDEDEINLIERKGRSLEFLQQVEGLKKILDSNSVYLAHGIGTDSLRRISKFNYTDADNIEVDTLFHHAMHLTLGARLLISSCLVDLQASEIPLFYAVGFLYKVSSEMVYCAYDRDAQTPMEGGSPQDNTINTPERFRRVHLEKEVIKDPQARKEYNSKLKELKLRRTRCSNVLECAVEDEIIAAQKAILDGLNREITELELKYKNESLYPKVKVFKRDTNKFSLPKTLYPTSIGANEVAFVSRTENPTTTAKIVGIYIKRDARCTVLDGGIKDSESPEATKIQERIRSIMIQMGADLGLPVIDFDEIVNS